MSDDNPDQERYSFEMAEAFNPIAHEKQFLGELKDIRKVADSFEKRTFSSGKSIEKENLLKSECNFFLSIYV